MFHLDRPVRPGRIQGWRPVVSQRQLPAEDARPKLSALPQTAEPRRPQTGTLGVGTTMKLKLARDALIVTILVLFGALLAFGQDKLDFLGATSCSCKIESVADNRGDFNGYQVAVGVQYQDPPKMRWNRTMQLFR